MDVTLQCIVPVGQTTEFVEVNIDDDDDCIIELEADVSECGVNPDEFLRLHYYDPNSKCYSMAGINNNNGNVEDVESTILAARFASNHLTQFVYADRQPLNFSETKFRAIWGVIIAFHTVMMILLFISFIMCLIMTKSDFDRKAEYEMDEEVVQIDPSQGINIMNPNAPDADDRSGADMDDGAEAQSLGTKSKSGKSVKSKTGVSSVVSTYRNYKNGKKRSFCGNYWITFFLKHPLSNPLIGRHPRVNRFSRGLIHYTDKIYVLNIMIGWLHPSFAIWDWWTSAIFSWPLSFLFSRIYVEVSYLLHDWSRKVLTIILSVIYLLVNIGF